MDELPLRPNPGPELLPPAPPNLAYLALAFTALVVAAGLLLLVRWWRRPRRTAALLPQEWFRLELTRLNAALTTAQASPDAALEALAGLLRRFLHLRYQLPAPEQTTEEFRAVLASCDMIEEERKKQIMQLLERADLSKFARLPATVEEVQQCLRETASIAR